MNIQNTDERSPEKPSRIFTIEFAQSKILFVEKNIGRSNKHKRRDLPVSAKTLEKKNTGQNNK
jgi:hypothetical protein